MAAQDDVRRIVREELQERAKNTLDSPGDADDLDREEHDAQPDAPADGAAAGGAAGLAALLAYAARRATAAPSGHYGEPGQVLEAVYTDEAKDTNDAQLLDLPTGGPIGSTVIANLPQYASDPSGTSAGDIWLRTDTEEVRVHTESNGVVGFPLVTSANVPTDAYEIVKVEVASGTRVLPVADPVDAEGDYVRLYTQSHGAVGLHKDTGVATLSNYLEDDWDDNSLTGRTGQTRDAFMHPSDNHAGDVFAGVYRPDWVTVAGSPSATGGHIEFPDGGGGSSRQMVRTGSYLSIGTWEIDVTPQSSFTSSGFMIGFLWSTPENMSGPQEPQEGYSIIANGSNPYSIRKRDTGGATDVISSTWAADTSTTTMKSTRDPYGNFELFEDGASQGTGTDTTYVQSVNFSLFNGLEAVVHADNLVVN